MSDCMTQEDAMNMDNQQAINILQPLKEMMRDQNGCPISDAYFALDKAINALTAEPKRGKWTKENACEFCGYKPWYERDIHTLNFCPWCGADMRGDKNDT